METGTILSISLIIAGILLWGCWFYIYPQVHRWTDCDHDTETSGWNAIKFCFGVAPILVAFGVHTLFNIHPYISIALLLISPISLFVIYRLKKV